MKKFLNLLLLLATAISFSGCGDEDFEELFKDTDFDGLYDLVDPTIDSNITGITLGSDLFSLIGSNEIKVSVDYRNFLYDEAPTYNKDLGVMMAVIANYSYGFEGKTITTSEYKNEESEINPILVQFGFEDLKYVVPETYGIDKFDICGLYLGNHLFINEGKKYQIFMVSVQGYPTQECWVSNFEIGINNDEYFESTGFHPEWTNSKHHKGIDVTANRAFNEVEKYVNEYKCSDIDDCIIAVTGHSRGGGITNLLGKKLKDNNYKSIAYGFNGLNVTGESNKELLKSYTNVFMIDSASDFVSRYPFKQMGFTSYGNILSYDLREHNNEYNAMYNHDFYCNSDENLKKVEDLSLEIFPSRAAEYKFLEPDPEIDEYFLCSDYESASKKLADMNKDFEFAKIEKSIKAEILANEDEKTSEEFPYKVQYYTAPHVILSFVARAIVTAKYAEDKVISLLDLFNAGLPYISKYLSYASKYNIELNVSAFACPHLQKTCILGAAFAE